ncbi:MAG: alpha/beta hydrolase [Spirochaetota bacterium]
MTLLWIILLLAGLLPAAYFAVASFMGRKVIYQHRHSTAYTLGFGLLNEEFGTSELDLPWEYFELVTTGGLTIRGQLLDNTAGRTVVFCHGITWTRYGMFKYLEPFLDGSWNLVLYDHRAHGESEGRFATYGVFERRDLADLMRMVRRRWPGSATLLYGESMGAATVLQYLADDPLVTAAIADCPFSSLRGELVHQLFNMGVPARLHGLLLAIVRRYIQRKAQFDFKRVEPAADALASSCPLLLTHGAEDNYVPTRMSEELYRVRRPKAPTTLHLTPEAGHAESINTDRQTYIQVVREFIEGIAAL